MRYFGNDAFLVSPSRLTQLRMIESAATQTAQDIEDRWAMLQAIVVSEPRLNETEWETVDSLKGTVTSAQAQACAGIINSFVDGLEEGGTAGMSANAYAWFSKTKTALEEGSAKTDQLIALYQLAKSLQQVPVKDCILSIIAYEAHLADTGIVDPDAQTESTNGFVPSSDVPQEPEPKKWPMYVGATLGIAGIGGLIYFF